MHDENISNTKSHTKTGAGPLVFKDLILADPACASDEMLAHFARALADAPRAERRKHFNLLLNKYRDALNASLTDPLTGLLNREGFLQKLQSKITGLRASGNGERRQAGEHNAATVFIDLDGFKAVNDFCGHEAGDDALRQVGERLKSVFRTDDVIARIGGDEIALMLQPYDPDASFNESVIKARIHKALQGLVFWHEKKPYPICASIGVVIFNENTVAEMGDEPADDLAQSLLTNADQRMYSDKRHGKVERLDEARSRAIRDLDIAA